MDSDSAQHQPLPDTPRTLVTHFVVIAAKLAGQTGAYETLCLEIGGFYGRYLQKDIDAEIAASNEPEVAPEPTNKETMYA
jgi:hypothetical protein